MTKAGVLLIKFILTSSSPLIQREQASVVKGDSRGRWGNPRVRRQIADQINVWMPSRIKRNDISSRHCTSPGSPVGEAYGSGASGQQWTSESGSDIAGGNVRQVAGYSGRFLIYPAAPLTMHDPSHHHRSEASGEGTICRAIVYCGIQITQPDQYSCRAGTSSAPSLAGLSCRHSPKPLLASSNCRMTHWCIDKEAPLGGTGRPHDLAWTMTHNKQGPAAALHPCGRYRKRAAAQHQTLRSEQWATTPLRMGVGWFHDSCNHVCVLAASVCTTQRASASWFLMVWKWAITTCQRCLRCTFYSNGHVNSDRCIVSDEYTVCKQYQNAGSADVLRGEPVEKRTPPVDMALTPPRKQFRYRRGWKHLSISSRPPPPLGEHPADLEAPAIVG